MTSVSRDFSLSVAGLRRNKRKISLFVCVCQQYNQTVAVRNFQWIVAVFLLVETFNEIENLMVSIETLGEND